MKLKHAAMIYAGAGVAFAVYDYLSPPATPFVLIDSLEEVAFWPYYLAKKLGVI